MSFLQDFLEKRRATREENEQSPEDLLQALVSNMQQVVSLTDRSVQTNRETKAAVVGAVSSATAQSFAQDKIAHSFTKEQVAVLSDYADSSKKTARITNSTLLEINQSLLSLGDSLQTLVKYNKPKTSKENTRSKRMREDFPTQSEKDRRSKNENRSSSRSPVDSLMDDMFDFNQDDRRGRQRGRRGRRGGRGAGRLSRVPTIGNPNPDFERPSGWDRLKEKVGGGKQGLSNLWKKIPTGVKAGGVLSAITAGAGLYNIANNEDPNVDKAKEVTKLAGSTAGSFAGFSAGASAGAALGALGGPAAPVTVPLGALIGGLGGSFLGSELGESITSSIYDVYKTSIVPGFTKASEEVSKYADSVGTNLTDFVSSFGKKFDEFKDEVSEGSNAASATASGIWAALKTRAGEAAEATKQAVGTVRTGYAKGGLAGAASSTKEAASQFVEGTKRSARGFASDVANTKGLAAGRWTDEEYAAIQKAQAGGEKFKGGRGLSQEVKDKITAKAKEAGVDPQHLLAMAQMESGGNANAVSSTGAAGLFQFTGGTAKQYGVKNRFDADQNIDGAIKLYKDNKAALEKRGEKATLENIYLAHQQGAGGAASLLKASRGEGAISGTVAKNMSVNVGANAGGATDAEKAQRFIAENAKHIQAASVKAQNVTVADSKPAPAPASVASASVAPVAGATPVAQASPTATSAAPSSQPSTPKAPSVSFAKSAPVAPAIQSVRSEPMKTFSDAGPAEAKPVVVANAEQLRQAPAPRTEQQAPTTPAPAPVGTPTLDSIPIQLTDMGLVLLNMGHI